MNREDIRAIVREELVAILAAAATSTPAPRPPKPALPRSSAVEAWLRTLAVGTAGTATEMLNAFRAAGGGSTPANAYRMGLALTALRDRLVTRSRRRNGVSVYTVIDAP